VKEGGFGFTDLALRFAKYGEKRNVA